VLPSGAGHGDLEHGVHEFAEPFEVEPDGRPVLTVDTRLGDLVESAEGMRVLTGVVTKYVPDAAGHMESGLRGQDDVTPRQVAAMLPDSDAVLADLERGLAAVSNGEEIPEDVLRAPEPDDADDELGELAALLTGAGFWATRAGRGIRPLVLTDGPHGVRRQPADADHLGVHESLPATCFPTGAALGASWNPTLAEAVGRALGEEARALGVDVLLGPGINLKRSPLGGRNFEYL